MNSSKYGIIAEQKLRKILGIQPIYGLLFSELLQEGKCFDHKTKILTGPTTNEETNELSCDSPSFKL